ncbi:HET-domain-containing protein [Sporormia fimetaria CBS 119925]|uniref:HET-domain-containing protein n=1 Tax=Sporormia fimetaria CBS 119925 TaxID=1340428 RepID=A0A6A6VNG4_9PLEO|nr:HET-domain-containing protein [Sporormia fimetaria CBS 119925]
MASSTSSFEFTFRCPPPANLTNQLSNPDDLCDECAKLDLDQSFTAAFDLYEGTRRGKYNRPFTSCRKDWGPVYLKDFYYVCSFGTRLSSPSKCSLCTFFRKMVTHPSQGSYKLLAFCSSESYLFEPRKKDARGQFVRRPWEERRQWQNENGKLMTEMVMDLEHNVFMALVPEVQGIPKTGVPLRWFETMLPENGCVYRVGAVERGVDRLVLPREIGAQINWNLARSWLSRCRCKHTACVKMKPVGEELRGFKVINCWKTPGPDAIEARPWSERYVALSYVWEYPVAGKWPQTILDAVEATKRMGERYLWVDRLCIDQSEAAADERKFLIGKMDAIYEGAEFTIVCAAGDGTTGLPGVGSTTRKPQSRIELSQRSAKAKGKTAVREVPDSIKDLCGVTEEEYESECAGESGWMDTMRFGLRGQMAMDLTVLLEDQRLEKDFGIDKNELLFFRDFAKDLGTPVEQLLQKFSLVAEKEGISLKAFCQKVTGMEKMPAYEGMDATPDFKPQKPLPANVIERRLRLVSTMQEPRVSIQKSKWSTRGWTYQEGVLSNRRLVFTPEQVYWECNAMAVCETVNMSFKAVEHSSGHQMADYMLSGIFQEDLHNEEELQYGFHSSDKGDVGDQVLQLDGHIEAFTSRDLTKEEDSLKAFLGVAARYRTDAGLLVLMGLPVWTGPFSDDAPGLQYTFALSLCSWTHVAQRVDEGAEMYVTDRPCRRQFPSWTWAGWQGRVEFCSEKQAQTHQDDAGADFFMIVKVLPGPDADPPHSDFFKAMTSKGYHLKAKETWSAEIVLHNADNTEATLLTGWAPVWNTGDPYTKWLLTIPKPIILRHMHLMESVYEGEWRRLMGKVVKVHLSVPLSEQELREGHKTGDLVSVLLFASTVPFVWNGIARFLILRKETGQQNRWERIGRLNMWLTEDEWNEYTKKASGLISALPVKTLDESITIS